MRMHLEGVKNPQISSREQQYLLICSCVLLLRLISPVAAPTVILVPIAIAMTASTTQCRQDHGRGCGDCARRYS